MSFKAVRQPQVLLAAADVDRSLRFYRGLPDFRPASSGPGWAEIEGPGGTRLVLAAPGADLSTWDGVPRAKPHAWVYLQRPDLISLAGALRDRGLSPTGPVEPYPGYRHLLLPDPDGYVIAFWEPLPVSDEQILALYRTGPDRLEAAVAGLDDAVLDRPRAPGKWSLRQIVHHIVDSDLGTLRVIQLALALPGHVVQTTTWEPDEWLAGLRAVRRPIGAALKLFRAAREWVLEALPCIPDALDRWVAWPSGYRAEVRTLLRQVGGHAVHHILQIEEARRAGRAG